MPIYSPTGFLDITNATLRTSNLEAQNFKLNGGNIYVTSELTTDELLNLDNVVNAGNATSNTVQFTNVTTGLVADSNIVVTGNVTAGSFLGDGSGLTSIPPSAITGTLSQWSDGANGDVYIASNVGIGNVHTLTSNTLQVGANLYVRDADANVLTVTGNVAADYFEGDGSKLTGISSTLQAITDSGNVTSNTVQFSNATTGFVTTSNIEVGGALKINTITAAAYHSLQAVTNVGNVTSNTVQFSNATTGLVTTANVEVGGELTVSGNVSVDTDTLFVDTATSRVGVGTGTPEATLHVEGNVYVSSNLEVDGSTISTTIVSDGVPNISWAKSIGGTSTDSGYGIATDSGGNVYVTGEYRGTADFGSGTSLTSAGSDDVYVAKYDTSGTVQWAKSIGGTSSNFGYDIATDSSGNVYVTGQYNGIVDFGPSTSLTSAGSGDAFVAKYDTNGTVRWATSIGGTSSNFGYGIATDSSGNVYVTGHYNGIVDFGPSTSLTGAGISRDAFVAKYNTSGTVQWAKSIGGTATDSGQGIATDSSGNVYVTGRYNGTANFGSGTSLTSAGSTDVFIAKYSPPKNLNINKSVDIQGDVNMLHTSNTAALKINSNVVTEFPRSKKLIKYPRVALTGQTTSNYIVTGSSWYNSPALGGSGTQYEPWKAFDNVGSHPTGQLAWYSFDYPTTEAYSGTDNAFNPNHGGTATPDLFTGAVQGEWLKIQLPHKVALDHYIMYGPNQESEFPRDWTVYGSADGTNWVRVDDRVSQIFGAGTGGGGTATGKKKEYQLDTQTDEYLYFAFVFTRGSVNRTQYVGVGEIELFGVPEYDPEADGVDVTVKSLPNVPNTDWLEVYYDAKDLADGSTTVNDLKPVGTAINGTVAGNTSVTDGAFTFDGSGDYISGTLSSSATGDWVHSLSMWFKADSFSATSPHTLFYGGGTSISANNLIFLRVDGGDNPHIHYSDIGTAVQKNMSVFTDVWYHVTATYSGGGWANAKLYINGELTNDTLTDTTPLTLTGSSTFYIGKAINSSNPSFNGSIANFRLFNRVLTSDEIYQLYAYQKEYFGHGVLGMTLKAGRLGIGTSEPKAALDVRGTISINGQILGLGRVSGGNDIFDVDGYRVHVFTTSGNFWVLSSDLLVDILLVGGGGGGGQDNAGGGGAGGLIFKPDHGLQVGGYTVIIGSGGSGCIEQNNGPEAKVGGNTEIKRLSNGSSDLVAYGGGAGMNGGNERAAERNGGSGAGGASEGTAPTGGGTATQTGTYGYGNNGGTGVSDAGGGGGGAGVAGQHGSTDGAGYGGIGGDGLSGVTGYDFAEIFGTRYGELIGEDVWFAGGGAGANINYSVNNTIGGSFRRGGKGGGGGGPILSDRSVEVTSGLPNTGGGGNGAGWFAGTPYNIGTELHGGDGGSGIVIFRYKL